MRRCDVDSRVAHMAPIHFKPRMMARCTSISIFRNQLASCLLQRAACRRLMVDRRYWDSNCFLAWLQEEEQQVDQCQAVLSLVERARWNL